MTQVIEVAARTVGEGPRRGEIVETLADGATPHYRVRWQDGHESIVYSTAGVRVLAEEDEARTREPVARLLDALRSAGVPFEVIPHRRTTSAVAEARALGVRPEAIGKTVIVRADKRRIRVVLPASRRLDLHKLASVTGTRTVLLTEQELREQFPGFDLGAVPPFGDADDCVLLDTSLADEPSVIIEAGSHGLSVRLAPRDLILVANARVADVAA